MSFEPYILKYLKEIDEVKCPNCHAVMETVDAGKNRYFFRCDKCGYTIGEPEDFKEKEEAEKVKKSGE